MAVINLETSALADASTFAISARTAANLVADFTRPKPKPAPKETANDASARIILSSLTVERFLFVKSQNLNPRGVVVFVH